MPLGGARTHTRMYNHMLTSVMVKALLHADGLMRRSKIDADAPLAPPQLALTPDPPPPPSLPPHTDPWWLSGGASLICNSGCHPPVSVWGEGVCVRVCWGGCDDDPYEMEKQTDR